MHVKRKNGPKGAGGGGLRAPYCACGLGSPSFVSGEVRNVLVYRPGGSVGSSGITPVPDVPMARARITADPVQQYPRPPPCPRGRVLLTKRL